MSKLSFEELIKTAGLGAHEEKYGKMTDEQKKLETARAVGAEVKADEVFSTINNTNWTDVYGAINDIKELAMKDGALMAQLQGGFEGDNLPTSYPIPYNVTKYFAQGKTQWEDEARPSFNIKTITDSKNTLSQAKLILEFGVSDSAVAHATDKQLYDKILAMLSEAATRTMESMIINGDTETGATGNVNSDDQAPATTFAADGGASYHATLLDHGIRELAINNSLTVDISGFDSDDMKAVERKLSARYQTPGKLLYISEPVTANAMAVDDGFKLASSRSIVGTIDSGVVARPWGVPMIVSDLVPKTEADGKVSATPGNNTLGQFLCVVKDAIRWGFGIPWKVEVERVPAYGYHMVLSGEFGFTILDNTGTCAAGINVTV